MGKALQRVNPGRVRQRFSADFKRAAVRLLEQGQKPAMQLALELGVRRNQLYKWQAQIGQHGAQAFHGAGRPRLSELTEVQQLKRENRRLKEELEIIKKAQAYYERSRR